MNDMFLYYLIIFGGIIFTAFVGYWVINVVSKISKNKKFSD